MQVFTVAYDNKYLFINNTTKAVIDADLDPTKVYVARNDAQGFEYQLLQSEQDIKDAFKKSKEVRYLKKTIFNHLKEDRVIAIAERYDSHYN